MIIKMMHGCDAFDLHDSMMAKRAIKIRNESGGG